VRFKQYISEGTTSATTFYHEVCTGIFLKKPTANIKHGGDVKKYFDDHTIQPAKTTNHRGIAPMSIDNALTKAQMKFLTKESIPKNSILTDALSVAKGLRSVVGKPDSSKSVYWTGPTNDSSKYGAADITFISKGIIHPVSLKFGAGQLKNLTLSTLGSTLLDGILPKGDTLGKAIFEDPNMKKHWNELTTEWIQHLFKKATNDGDKETLLKYSGISWDSYQKQKLSDDELKMVSVKVKTNQLREFCRRLYKQDKEWTKIRSDIFDKIFPDFFYQNDEKLEENFVKVFKQQVSSGELDTWYAANAGKKIIFIPHEESFNRLSTGLEFDLDTQSTTSGYQIILKVMSEKKKVMIITINIIIRWKQGQMVGKPDATSNIGSKFKPDVWNQIFKK